ncbi:MAG: insulinase family protein [Clostridia bacterium]|nr:insulinase family protein [Clostridia bacterium]
MNNIAYTEISKSVRILCVNTDKFKTNCIKVDFYLPIGEYFPAQNVLASYMGHTSKKYSTVKAFNSKVEGMYDACFDTTVSTVGEKVRIRFSMEILDDKFSIDGNSISQEAVDFLVEILSNPNATENGFDEELTTREIRFTLENIEAMKNDKRAYAVSRLRQLMCKDEPYGIDNEKLEEGVRNLDGKQLLDAYKDMLKTATVVITACGSVDSEMLKDKFEAFAEKIENRNPAELETVFVTKADEIRYFKEEMDVNQAKLVIGLRAGMKDSNDDYFAYRVMTDIFGGGPYSRLFLNVREKMSLCYYCGARLIREKGIILIQSGIEEENYEKALSEILNQLDIMKKGEFTDEDFNSSIIALCDAFKGVEDSPVAVCNFYSSQEFDEKIISGEEFAKKIGAVTREQVIECAKRVSVDTVYLLKGEENND